MITKITHLSLFVNDLEETLTFFTKSVGFRVHTDHNFSGTRWLTLCLPDQPDFELVLMQAKSPEEKAIVGKQANGVPLCALQTTDCKKEYERLKKNGVFFIDEPKEEAWGIGVSFKDVCGNIWYLNQEK